MAQPDLLLYMYPSCPYCALVLRAIEQLGVEVPTRDIRADPDAFEEFSSRTGGRTQVPCLFIDGKPMWESADIATWLKKQFS